jgi:hypothetical protein
LDTLKRLQTVVLSIVALGARLTQKAIVSSAVAHISAGGFMNPNFTVATGSTT